ncbi:hypothetical protein L226DRAFT_614322 [Lentinus tigrinus ALCF2SS1-7]|uniref:Uncharacterized protein n=1 Tax=Lentinus tigrinus ALCF2SS1-6 TaxID=1328759 RepID=A0A5C2S345_9APHY|nr:hypothetical protein L227DRAFT_655686 [Lentinus tigrinus ALCF2SS1-6]RPD73057.1 hypothetical protein L226DRAFT_614322 [Lentinus tigrinus ALCF2SS1-7]
MDLLPIELLSSIFSFACTDGGYTGTSLSATSKYLNALSQPYALQSIALYGWPHIVAFSTSLQARNAAQTPPYLRLRCFHLYMTDRSSACPSRVCHDGLPGCNGDSYCDPSLRVVPGTSIYVGHAHNILTILGPQLRTLTLLLSEELNTFPSAGTVPTFPCLEELTIHSSFLRALTDNRSCMPRLRRLHIIQDIAFDYHFVSAVSTLAPALTHLRLSELSTAVYQTGDLIHHGVASLVGPSGELAGFSEALEKVILQFRHADSQVSCETISSGPLAAYSAAFFAAQLRSILSALWRYIQHDSKRRVVVLPTCMHRDEKMNPRGCSGTRAHLYEDVRRSWAACAAGEEGLWSIQESDVLLAYGLPGLPNLP